MSVLWAWFVSTKIARWIVGLGAVLTAAAVLAYTMFLKGKHEQATTDEAKAAKIDAEAAVVAQEVQTDASQAAATVEQQAKAQPPPNTESRNDLDTNF